MMATEIRPEKILKDLAKLWVDLAKGETDPNSAGVLRACAMTLIVAVDDEQEAQSVGETIAELMHEHPSRAIVLHVEAGGESDGLDVRVFAQCWMPFGRRQQICCEEVEITAPEPLLADVPKLLLGITVPDLPVVLWIRNQRMATHAEFQQIFPLTTKILVDTTRFEDQDFAYHYIEGMNQRGINMVDLAWTRLTRWREMIAQVFENERYRPDPKSIDTVIIGHTGEAIPVGARYLSCWLQHALPRTQVRYTVESGPEGAVLTSVQLIGDNFQASVTREDAGAATVRINDLTQRIAMPVLNDVGLLREELSIIGVDQMFRRCFD